MVDSSGKGETVEHDTSLDEDDIHQCGRCKETFISIDEYFLHKKAKQCQKVSDPSKALSTVKGSKPAPHGTECSPDNTARPYRRKGRPRRVQAKAARSRTRPRDSSGEESVNRATKTVPAEGDAVLDRSKAMDEPPAEAEEGREGGSVYSRKHLRRRCSAPKKAWVEDYQGEQEKQSAVRNSSSGKDDARNRSTEDADLIEEIAAGDSQENPAMDIQPETVALQEPRKRNLRQHRQRRKGFFDGRKSKGYSDKVMHSCPACDYEVEHKDEFDRHLRRVHNLSNYVCPYCSSPFKDQYKLKRHLNQKRCKKMKDHKKKHISYAEFNASNKILNKVVRVAQEDECKEESGMAESENTFSCMQCEVTEASYEDICEHVKTEHPEVKPGICRFCGIWRMSKYRLWRHMVSSVHDNIDEDTLKAAKEELGSLDFSSEKVTLKRTRRCSTCPKAFPTKAILLQHVKSAHPQLPKQHICEHCGQEFTTKQQLAAHLRLSHAKKAARKTIPDGMQCPVCQRVFKQRSHTARHRESLHSPRQQVPADVIAADHNSESISEESQRASPSVIADLAQKENEEHSSIGKTCFVCCETLSNDRSKKLQHLHDHRVWRAHPEYGTQPPDLLEMMYSTNFIPAPTSLCSKTKKSTDLEPGATSATNSAERQDDGSDPGVLAKASAEILATIRDGEKGEAATQQQIPLTTIDQSALSSLMHDQAMWEQVMFRDVDHAEETAAMAIGSVELNPDPVPPINIQPVAVASSGLVSDAAATVPEAAKMPETNSGLFEHTSSGIAEEMNLIRNEAMLEDHAYWSHNEQDMETTNSANSTAPEQPQELFLKSHEANDNGSTSSSQACINESQEPPNTSTWNDRSLKQESFSRVDAQKETSAEERERNYICPYCLKVCETVSEIYWHKVNDHRLVSVFCCVKSNCHKTFESLKDYFEHSKEHSQHAFICGICNEHFEELRDTIVHKGSAHRNIHKMDGNRCNVCHRSFISKEALQEHAKQAALHYQCSHCGKVMKTRAEQRDHELSHIGKESFLCDLCGATFVNKTTLSRHRLTHKTLRKHHCPQCDTVFNKPEHLRRHLQTKHSDEKPFKCPAKNCGRSFKRKDKLQAHKKMHSGDKPYSCDLCGRRYCYKDGLRYHEKTHKRANQYLCHTCQLPFPQPGQLMSHMVADHGLTIKDTHVHACQQCDKTFPRPERLKHHMERIHNVQPQWRVFCQVCKQGFPGNKSLETHMSKKHPMGRVELLSQSGRRRRKINRKITSDPAVVNASIQDVGKTEVKVTAIQDQRAVEQPLMDTIVVMDPNTGIQHQMSAQFFNTTLVNAGQEAPPQTTAAPTNQSDAILGPAIGQQYQLVNLMQNKVSGFMPGEQLPDNINASAATSVEATPTQTPTPGPVMEETQPLALLTNQVNPSQLTVALTATQNTLLTVNQKEATPSPPPGQLNAVNAPSVIGEAQPPQQRYINLAHLPANVLNEIMTQLQTGNQGNPTQITLLPSHMTANSQVAPPNMTIQYTTDPNTYMNNY